MADATPFRGGLAVFSGPSGSGKTSLCRNLLEDSRVHLSVSATTREPRAGEVDGVDYHFVDRSRFQQMVDEGALVEWAEVYGNCYGTPAEPLRRASGDRSRLMILDIDVQGALQLRRQGIEALFVFVAPPSMEVLERRLVQRGTDSPETIERRLRVAAEEMAGRKHYDHVLVNQDLDVIVREARGLLGL